MVLALMVIAFGLMMVCYYDSPWAQRLHGWQMTLVDLPPRRMWPRWMLTQGIAWIGLGIAGFLLAYSIVRSG